ncbi:MAG: hypothetical protein KF901_22565 [Myxococcales bacterium]|nr:hypothetical protein [Myxococcales bacterium]
MSRSLRLRGRVVPITALSSADRDAMWRVFRAYYADVTREAFEADLDEKDHVIVLRDSGDASLQGFSTLKVYDQKVEGRRVVAVFSGDTIVDEAYWGQSALHWTFLGFLARLKRRAPLTPVYWFLISKGYKTYLLLTRNFPEHWPRHDRPTSPFAKALLDVLATERYGDAYDPVRGVLSFPEPHGRLRQHVAPLAEDLLAQPDVRFFARANPRHAEGDELCCLGKVDLAFVLRGARRVLMRPLRRLWGRLPSLPSRAPEPERSLVTSDEIDVTASMH